MKEVIINQCDYCNKSSFNKGSLRAHEKKCFFNPLTQSCATCLWFSRKHNLEPIACFVGEYKYLEINLKPKLRTMCNKWMSAEVVEEVNIFDNEGGILDHLLAGDINVLKIIAKINSKNLNSIHT
jgi:hypothetical protein